jgi:cytochrome P450
MSSWYDCCFFVLFTLVASASNNPDLWEDVTEYNPDRFIDGNLPGKHNFLPFGLGARSCLGRKFAEMEMYLLLVYVIKNFTLINATEQKPKRTVKLLTSFDRDIFINVEPRQ